MSLFAKKTPSTSSSASNPDSSGGRLVSATGQVLPLLGAHLRADATGGVARVILEQTFQNPHLEPLHVTYQMPLPSDGAVSGYAFTLGEQRIVGEVDRKAKARERFEDAILQGRTAGLVDQERSSLFTQELGNVPPGAVIVAELVIDQKLAWLPEGAWEWRFPTVVAPRYLGEAGRVPDADKVTVDVADGKLRAGVSLALGINDKLAGEARPESPSHPIHSAPAVGRWDVTLSDETARLDRDVVIRWSAAVREPGLALTVARPPSERAHSAHAYGLLTLTPPSPRFEPVAQPRDLIVLLDTSGSMSGEPLEQARRVVSLLIESLTEKDRLELIEFSNSARRWKGSAVEATVKMRKSALSWLEGLRASGGTEMRTGVMEALAPLRDEAQRQVIIVTDGLIGSENEVLETIMQRLPSACRVHCVGVGSAVNRSLSQPAARAGRGVELIIGLGEDPERGARRLVARTCAPLITGLTVSGSAVQGVAPARIPDVFAGAPSLVSLRLRPEGGELIVRGQTAEGVYEQRLRVDESRAGSGPSPVCALFARESVEDLELERAGGASGARTGIDAKIEELGIAFQISTRLTSWIAVSAEKTVDATSPTRRHQVPQELPHGMSLQGLGLRPVAHAMPPPPPGAAPVFTKSVAMAPAPRGRADRASSGEMKKQEAPELAKGGAGPAMPRKEKRRAEPEQAPLPKPSFELLDVDEDEGTGSAINAPSAPAPQPSPADAERKQDRPSRDDQDLGGKTRAGSLETVRGRIVRRADGELVVELELPLALDWPAGKTVRVLLDDGRVVEAQVDASRTTRAGRIEAGMTVRLALTFPAGSFGAADPRQLIVPMPVASLVISL